VYIAYTLRKPTTHGHAGKQANSKVKEVISSWGT